MFKQPVKLLFKQSYSDVQHVQDALSMEEVVKLFSTAFEQICGLREVDKLVLERFRIIFQAAKDYGSLLAKKVLFLGIDVSSEWVVYKYDQGTWALMWPKAWIEILADDDYLKNYINQELDRYEEVSSFGALAGLFVCAQPTPGVYCMFSKYDPNR